MNRLLSLEARHRLLKHLRQGGVVAYPTESCFGLGCLPHHALGLKRLLKLKRRAPHKGLIVVGASLTQLQPFVQPFSPEEKAHLLAHWPGAYSFIVPVRRRVLPLLRGQYSELAVRVPAHSFTRALCQQLRTPLVSTSANFSGQPALKTAAACRRVFKNQIQVIEGKIAGRKTPSTVIHLKTQTILRG